MHILDIYVYSFLMNKLKNVKPPSCLQEHRQSDLSNLSVWALK